MGIKCQFVATKYCILDTKMLIWRNKIKNCMLQLAFCKYKIPIFAHQMVICACKIFICSHNLLIWWNLKKKKMSVLCPRLHNFSIRRSGCWLILAAKLYALRAAPLRRKPALWLAQVTSPQVWKRPLKASTPRRAEGQKMEWARRSGLIGIQLGFLSSVFNGVALSALLLFIACPLPRIWNPAHLLAANKLAQERVTWCVGSFVFLLVP